MSTGIFLICILEVLAHPVMRAWVWAYYSSVASVEYDVIYVTETWLCEDIDSWYLFDDRYLVYRKDRGSSSNSSRRGGGVLVAIKKCLSPRKLDVPGLDLEAIWISPSTDWNDGNDGCRSDCVGDLVKFENVTYDDVVLAISELKSSLTVDVDNVPSFIIKDKIISSFESGSQLDVIYNDFSKAFDSIDFDILLKKLQGIGFHVNLIDWLLSYLCKRSLYVYFNNAVFHEFTSTSGVPQGSNLGLLLFILFINDLTWVFKYSGCLLFADDLKLFGSIRSDLDSVLLQRDLDRLFKWCIDNRLHLNIEKCSVLSYTRKTQPLIHVYKINNLVLSLSNTVTDLGIIFDSKLDFSQHIDTMVSKTYRRLGFLKRRTREFSSELTLKVLYCAHIRSNLEYCSIIWNPNYRNKIEIIERIQNNF
ncbi:hypothetical protein AVEN_253710-1 [Araneus ventricosus]|uniref:Reverse transcriptase domain-containing protein n=1 Tax=Araneus ventricosus TaxID=182803 RepID=A0A4Y2DY17_ARAVE|nr:hypothetical protein AVEN_253710-1 [Araneus ventricosus]